MTACLLVLLLAGEGSAVDVPRVARELAEIGMPVDVDKVRLWMSRRFSSEVRAPRRHVVASRSEQRRRAGRAVFDDLLGLEDAARAGAAGWYDPVESVESVVRIGVKGTYRLDGIDGIVAHELAHAYQDQRYQLFKPHAWVSSDDDFVRSAIWEGEAQALRIRRLCHLRKKELRSGDWAGFVWRAGLGGGGTYLRYEAGTRYVLLLPSGSNPHHKRPANSEALLHPEKRNGKKPTPATWIDVPESHLLLEDTFGEAGIYQFALFLGPAAATKASIGWDGDDLRVYRSERHGAFALWVTHWDREQDAVEFRDALSQCCFGTFVRDGRRVVWVGAEKVSVGETLWNRAMAMPAPPPADPREATLTGEIQKRELTVCRPSGQLRSDRWSLGNSGASMELPAGWTIGWTDAGHIPRTPPSQEPGGYFGTTAWPARLFENAADLEKHLRTLRLARVDRVERSGSALLVERILVDDHGTPFAHTVELFIFTPQLLLHVFAQFENGVGREILDPVRDAMRTARVDAD